jgi:hypothetical protein
VSVSKSPEQRSLKGFNSLKEYSLQFTNNKNIDIKKIFLNLFIIKVIFKMISVSLVIILVNN